MSGPARSRRTGGVPPRPGQVEPPMAVQPPVRPRSWAEGRLEIEVERHSLLGPRAWRWKVIGAVEGATLPATRVAGYAWTVQQAEHRGRKVAGTIRALRRATADSRRRFEA